MLYGLPDQGRAHRARQVRRQRQLRGRPAGDRLRHRERRHGPALDHGHHGLRDGLRHPGRLRVRPGADPGQRHGLLGCALGSTCPRRIRTAGPTTTLRTTSTASPTAPTPGPTPRAAIRRPSTRTATASCACPRPTTTPPTSPAAIPRPRRTTPTTRRSLAPTIPCPEPGAPLLLLSGALALAVSGRKRTARGAGRHRHGSAADADGRRLSAGAQLSAAPLPDGLVAFVKRDCPTCVLVAPVLARARAARAASRSTRQDDPAFPDGVARVSTTARLAVSWHHDIETVPTLLRVEDGARGRRAPSAGTAASGRRSPASPASAPACPRWRPGCGSRSVDPSVAAELAVRFGAGALARAGASSSPPLEDELEALFERGWTDGLPGRAADASAACCACSRARTRAPDEIVAVGAARPRRRARSRRSPINAVMAGCKPEYLPGRARRGRGRLHRRVQHPRPARDDDARRPGASIVNGPIRRAHRHERGHQRPRPGQPRQRHDRPRAAARGPQRRRRPARRGRPRHPRQPRQDHVLLRRGRGGLALDAALASTSASPPGAERRHALPGRGRRAAIVDQLSRDARVARAHASPRACAPCTTRSWPLGFDAILVVSPEHARVFREAGWDQGAAASRGCTSCSSSPASELVRGAGGIAEGMPEAFAAADAAEVPPRRASCIVHAGGGAGLFSAIIGGWANGDDRAASPSPRRIRP